MHELFERSFGLATEPMSGVYRGLERLAFDR